MAKASGVVIPSWGLLPLAAYGQQTAAPKILSTCTLMADLSRITSAIRPLSPATTCIRRRGLAIPEQSALGADRQQHDLFNRFRDQILMVNGVNTLSNSHDLHAVRMATGKLEMGFPALAELHAAKYGPSRRDGC